MIIKMKCLKEYKDSFLDKTFFPGDKIETCDTVIKDVKRAKELLDNGVAVVESVIKEHKKMKIKGGKDE